MAKIGKEHVTTFGSGLDRMDSRVLRVLRISTKGNPIIAASDRRDIVIEPGPSLVCGVIYDHIFRRICLRREERGFGRPIC